MGDLRLAQVVKVSPEAFSVDLVFIDTMARVPNVQVMTWAATQKCGWVDLPEPTPGRKEWDIEPSGDQDMLAVVGQANGSPLVLGFLHQQVTQLLFKEKNRRVVRHASDVYSTLNDAGDFEFYHPSGTHLRIAEDPEHEDLTGKDFDGKWKIERNLEREVTVKLVVKSGGAQTAAVTIAPAGDIRIETVSDMEVSVGGGLDLSVAGAISSAAGSWAHDGNLTVTGAISATDDVTAAGISLKSHKHGGVQGGSAQTGVPV